jgi:uncharacterized membrane protein
MDLGERLRAAWRSAAAEAGGIEHLTELFSRLALLFSGFWVLALVFLDWIRSPFFAGFFLTLLILGGFGLGIVDVALSLQIWIPARRLALFVPISAAYLVVVHYFVFVRLVPFYGTDGMAFSHYSALLLLQGRNPYTENLAPALPYFHIPEFYVTPTEGGGIVSRQTYPALSFLLYVPFAAAGVGDLRFLALLAHIVSILLVYRITPPPLRAFAALTLTLPDQLDFTPGSVQDILWVPPLLLSMYFLNRRKVSGVFYGIASSIKPLPWLIAPFLAVHLWKRDRSQNLGIFGVLQFAASAGASFLLFNGPFIAWDPRAWFSGVLDPFFGQNVPLGTGLSILSQSAWFPIPRGFYLVAVAAVGLGLLLTEYLEHPRMTYLVWWLPAILIFFAYRSLQNYFIYWYPMAIVSLGTWFRDVALRRTDASVA